MARLDEAGNAPAADLADLRNRKGAKASTPLCRKVGASPAFGYARHAHSTRDSRAGCP
jgi:hypothetical protein